MGQLWMLISGIGCLLLGISTQSTASKVNFLESRHLEFSNSFYKTLKDERIGDFATSPLGIDELLLMIGYGVVERTWLQLDEVVYIPRTWNDLLISHKSVTELMKQKFRNVGCKIANKIYVSRDAGILDSYKTILRNYFNARCTQIDFRRPKIAANTINREVATFTNNRITNAISQSVINRDTKMILMNVIYFKGKWKTPFIREYTKSKPFYRFMNETYRDEGFLIPSMYVEGEFKWFEDPALDATVVEMPYQDEDFSMIIILPSENTNLTQVGNKLRFPVLWSQLDGSEKRRIDLWLPKFKIESTLNLKPILEKMDIKDLFDERANLSRMTQATNMRVSRIEQKVFLEVNEEGTEAAAVSTSLFSTRSGSMFLEVDHPFLAILRYKNLNLFMARITDPRV